MMGYWKNFPAEKERRAVALNKVVCPCSWICNENMELHGRVFRNKMSSI
jgi:hypothetical protein